MTEDVSTTEEFVPVTWARLPDWMDDATCQFTDPDLFFPEARDHRLAERDGIQTQSAQLAIKQAKWICGRCPVSEQCLDYAIARDEEWGVWGGMTTGERLTEAIRRGVIEPDELAA